MPNWLSCTIKKGMFSDEFTAIVTTTNGEQVSVFVPKDSTQDVRGESGRVRVRVSERSGRFMAVLPDEHQSVVDVDSSQLQPA
jgi:hypothetical protein